MTLSQDMRCSVPICRCSDLTALASSTQPVTWTCQNVASRNQEKAASQPRSSQEQSPKSILRLCEGTCRSGNGFLVPGAFPAFVSQRDIEALTLRDAKLFHGKVTWKGELGWAILTISSSWIWVPIFVLSGPHQPSKLQCCSTRVVLRDSSDSRPPSQHRKRIEKVSH